MEETVKFTQMFDRFFDCLNVNDYESGKHSQNSFKDPYRSSKDFRLNIQRLHHTACVHDSI